jgi:hypothetical protein
VCAFYQSYVSTDGQSASVSWCQANIWGPRPDFCYYHTVSNLLMWGVLPDEKKGLSFTIAAGPHQRSHSRVRVPRDSWPYFTVLDSKFLQPGGPDLRIYILQEHGGRWPSYTPKQWVPFSSPPTTGRAMVSVFEPVSAPGLTVCAGWPRCKDCIFLTMRISVSLVQWSEL